MGGKLGQCEIRIFPHSHPEADSVVSGQTKRLFCSEGRPADIRAFSGMKFSKETYLGAMYTYDFCGVRGGGGTKSDFSTDELRVPDSNKWGSELQTSFVPRRLQYLPRQAGLRLRGEMLSSSTLLHGKRYLRNQLFHCQCWHHFLESKALA